MVLLKKGVLIAVIGVLGLVGNTNANPISVTVPGTANVWLAGMPDGTRANGSDYAPGQSPVLVGGLLLTSGEELSFSATGLVANWEAPADQFSGPDGNGSVTNNLYSSNGQEHGISDIYAPYNSLIGVFLSADQPDLSGAPGMLDFRTFESRDYQALSPLLKQVFFIGDGLTSGGISQSIIVPTGATRLFLGTMDALEWNNNQGSFAVTVNTTSASVPEPALFQLLGLGLLGATAFIRKRR